MVSGILRVAGIALAVLGVLFLVVGPSHVIFEEKFARRSAQVAPFSGNMNCIIKGASLGSQNSQILAAKAARGDGSVLDPLATIFPAGKFAFYNTFTFRSSTLDKPSGCGAALERSRVISDSGIVMNIPGACEFRHQQLQGFEIGSKLLTPTDKDPSTRGSREPFFVPEEHNMRASRRLACVLPHSDLFRRRPHELVEPPTWFLNPGFLIGCESPDGMRTHEASSRSASMPPMPETPLLVKVLTIFQAELRILQNKNCRTHRVASQIFCLQQDACKTPLTTALESVPCLAQLMCANEALCSWFEVQCSALAADFIDVCFTRDTSTRVLRQDLACSMVCSDADQGGMLSDSFIRTEGSPMTTNPRRQACASVAHRGLSKNISALQGADTPFCLPALDPAPRLAQGEDTATARRLLSERWHDVLQTCNSATRTIDCMGVQPSLPHAAYTATQGLVEQGRACRNHFLSSVTTPMLPNLEPYTRGRGMHWVASRIFSCQQGACKTPLTDALESVPCLAQLPGANEALCSWYEVQCSALAADFIDVCLTRVLTRDTSTRVLRQDLACSMVCSDADQGGMLSDSFIRTEGSPMTTNPRRQACASVAHRGLSKNISALQGADTPFCLPALDPAPRLAQGEDTATAHRPLSEGWHDALQTYNSATRIIDCGGGQPYAAYMAAQKLTDQGRACRNHSLSSVTSPMLPHLEPHARGTPTMGGDCGHAWLMYAAGGTVWLLTLASLFPVFHNLGITWSTALYRLANFYPNGSRTGVLRHTLVLLLLMVSLGVVAAVQGGKANATTTGGRLDAATVEKAAACLVQGRAEDPIVDDAALNHNTESTSQPRLSLDRADGDAHDNAAEGRPPPSTSQRPGDKPEDLPDGDQALLTWIAHMLECVRQTDPMSGVSDWAERELRSQQVQATLLAIGLVAPHTEVPALAQAIFRDPNTRSIMQDAQTLSLDTPLEALETDGSSSSQSQQTYSAAASRSNRSQPVTARTFNNTDVRHFPNTPAGTAAAQTRAEELFRAGATSVGPSGTAPAQSSYLRRGCSLALGCYRAHPQLQGPGNLVTTHQHCPYSWQEITSEQAEATQVRDGAAPLDVVVIGIPMTHNGRLTDATTVDSHLRAIGAQPLAGYTTVASSTGKYKKANTESLQTVHATVRLANTPLAWRLLAGISYHFWEVRQPEDASHLLGFRLTGLSVRADLLGTSLPRNGLMSLLHAGGFQQEHGCRWIATSLRRQGFPVWWVNFDNSMPSGNQPARLFPWYSTNGGMRLIFPDQRNLNAAVEWQSLRAPAVVSLADLQFMIPRSRDAIFTAVHAIFPQFTLENMQQYTLRLRLQAPERPSGVTLFTISAEEKTRGVVIYPTQAQVMAVTSSQRTRNYARIQEALVAYAANTDYRAVEVRLAYETASNEWLPDYGIALIFPEDRGQAQAESLLQDQRTLPPGLGGANGTMVRASEYSAVPRGPAPAARQGRGPRTGSSS